jgi:hypothetical protein
MAVTKEAVSLEGVLKGEGHERICRVKTMRHTTYADECASPTCFSYSKCEIEDVDDFPDGDYEVEFDAHRVPVTKKAGQYFLRCA